MKIGEEFRIEDDKLIHRRTFDVEPTLDRLAALRDAGVNTLGESVHVGTIPGWLVTQWLQEAGVKWEDSAARNEIIRKKLLSGEYSLLRNWQGTF